jgi:excisionase family DNA binding protein
MTRFFNLTEEERAEFRTLIAEAVAEALTTREPKAKKSRAGLLTLAEAGALVRTPPETIRRWIWEGKLTAYKPGKHQLVKEAELLALVEKSESTKKRAARTNEFAKARNES